MASCIKKTLNVLRTARERHDSVLISFSGGRDSFVLLDLCSRIFEHVECYHYFLLPHVFSHVEERLQLARDRYNVVIHLLPSKALLEALANSFFLPIAPAYIDDDGQHCRDRGIQKILTPADYARWARMISGLRLVANGCKRPDAPNWPSSSGASMFDRQNTPPPMIRPLEKWTDDDVESFLKSRGLPHNPLGHAPSQDISLLIKDVLWVHDKYPDDYAVMLRAFPFVGALAKHRQLYDPKAANLPTPTDTVGQGRGIDLDSMAVTVAGELSWFYYRRASEIAKEHRYKLKGV